jgi:hypothetical protein
MSTLMSPDTTREQDQIKYEMTGTDSHDNSICVGYERNSIINLTNCIDQVETSRNISKQVYGSDLKEKYPYRMGKLYTFLFSHGHPLIVIGPQCKP